MKRSPLPPEKPDTPDLWQCHVLTLEDTSSNICKNEGTGPTLSDHAHSLNIVQSNLEYITLLVGGENVIELGFVIKSEAFENEL